MLFVPEFYIVETVELVWNYSPKNWGMVIRFPIFPYHQKPYFFLSDTIFLSDTVFLHLIVECLSIYGEQLCSLALVATCCFQRSFYSLQFRFLIVQGGGAERPWCRPLYQARQQGAEQKCGRTRRQSQGADCRLQLAGQPA